MVEDPGVAVLQGVHGEEAVAVLRAEPEAAGGLVDEALVRQGRREVARLRPSDRDGEPIDDAREELPQAAAIDAFNEKRALTEDDVARLITNTVALSKTMDEQIKAIKSWAHNRAISASRESAT